MTDKQSTANGPRILRAAHSDKYLVLERAAAQDENLGAYALATLVYLLSKPDNWGTRARDIQRRFKCGRDKTEQVLGELQREGYLTKEVRKSLNGRLFGWDWYVHELPVPPEERTDTVSLKIRDTENPSYGKGGHIHSTENTQNTENTKDSMRESLSLSRGVTAEDGNTGEVSGEQNIQGEPPPVEGGVAMQEFMADIRAVKPGDAKHKPMDLTNNLTSPETEPSYPPGSNGQAPKPKRIDPLFEWVARSLHQLDPDKAGHDKDLSKWIGANVAKFVNAEKDHRSQDTPLKLEQRAALVEQLPGFLRFYYEQCPGCSPPSDKKKVAQYVQRWYDAGKPYSTKAVKVQYTAVIDDPYIASIPVK